MDRGEITIRPIVAADAITVADLHATSWRDAYRGMLRDEYLDGDVADGTPAGLDGAARRTGRLATTASSRRRETGPVGFVYMLGGDDATWGTLIDNLHVLPGLKGRGIGRRLLEAAALETAAPLPGRARPPVRVRGERRRQALLRQRRRPRSRARRGRTARRRIAGALARRVGRRGAAAGVGALRAEVEPGVMAGRREWWPAGPAVGIAAGIAILALPADVEGPALLPISPGHAVSLVDAIGVLPLVAGSTWLHAGLWRRRERLALWARQRTGAAAGLTFAAGLGSGCCSPRRSRRSTGGGRSAPRCSRSPTSRLSLAAMGRARAD